MQAQEVLCLARVIASRRTRAAVEALLEGAGDLVIQRQVGAQEAAAAMQQRLLSVLPHWGISPLPILQSLMTLGRGGFRQRSEPVKQPI